MEMFDGRWLQSQERVNLASKQPEIVAQLSKQMATYTPYVNPRLSAEELSKYDCVTTNVSGGVFPSPWWGEFNGPVSCANVPTSLPDTCCVCDCMYVYGRSTNARLFSGLQCCRPKHG